MTNTNRTILSVGELNAEVNQLLNQGFPLLWVEGEVSNLVRPSSGHLYFTLKDNKSQIRAAMFRNRNMKLSIKPENGMKVLVRGRVGLYEPRGEYQLIAEHMEDAGEGQLQKQFEALKQKLSNAGLFDEKYKQELPEYPKRIAIVTTPTGAAIRDILNVLKRRSPQTEVLIYPVAVQGETSKTQIESAIRKVDIDNKCDVLILSRGGGSIEDLWPFNEENVAKAIYNAKTPIITGVGHEIDFTIADFVADLRAPTPSAAAELVTPDREHLLTESIQTRLWLIQTINQSIKQKHQDLNWLTNRLLIQKPANKIQQQTQRLDELENRLFTQFSKNMDQKHIQINALLSRLQSNLPQKKILEQKKSLDQLSSRLKISIQSHLINKESKFQIQMTKLDAISPLRTLDRGYSIVKDKHTNSLVSSINQTKNNQDVLIKFKDGEVNANINN